MDKETLDTLINATAYHLETGSNYHIYIDCKHIRAKSTRSEELAAGKGKKGLCHTCRDRLLKVLRGYIHRLSP